MNQQAVISLEDACVFQNQHQVIDHAHVVVKPGEFVYLLGKTGSGKSTLLKLLYGELPLQSGKAVVAGMDLAKLKRKEIPFLRRKLGIVFQDFQLLSDRTVGENLLFVMEATGWTDKQKIQQRVKEVLEKVNLADKADKMPFQLSGGEQQRVAVARALVNEPEIILADEPTGNLDPETSAEIMKLFLDIAASGRSVLFATHDILLYNRFPARTLRFEAGKITDILPAGAV